MKVSKIYPTTLAIIALIAYSTVIISCKKYEEGPGLSLRSKPERLANNWTVEKYTENDVDKTADYTKDYDRTVEIDKEGEIISKLVYKPNGFTITSTGTWKFISDKEQVEVVFGNSTEIYQILRLTEDELWYTETKTLGNGSTMKYEYHMIEK